MMPMNGDTDINGVEGVEENGIGDANGGVGTNGNEAAAGSESHYEEGRVKRREVKDGEVDGEGERRKRLDDEENQERSSTDSSFDR